MSRPAVFEDLAWPDDALAAIEAEAASGRIFESCDLEDRQGLRPPENPSRWRAAFNSAARLGIIRIAGFGPSARPSRSGGLTRYWVGTSSISTKENSSDAHSTKNRIEAA